MYIFNAHALPTRKNEFYFLVLFFKISKNIENDKTFFFFFT